MVAVPRSTRYDIVPKCSLVDRTTKNGGMFAGARKKWRSPRSSFTRRRKPFPRSPTRRRPPTSVPIPASSSLFRGTAVSRRWRVPSRRDREIAPRLPSTRVRRNKRSQNSPLAGLAPIASRYGLRGRRDRYSQRATVESRTRKGIHLTHFVTRSGGVLVPSRSRVVVERDVLPPVDPATTFARLFAVGKRRAAPPRPGG